MKTERIAVIATCLTLMGCIAGCGTNDETASRADGGGADTNGGGKLDGGDGAPLTDSSAPPVQDDAGDEDATFPPGDNFPPDPPNAQSPWTLHSPDGKVGVTVTLSASGALSYAIDYADQNVIAATSIGLSTRPVDFSDGLAYQSGGTDVISSSYTIPTGKRTPYIDHANELTLRFTKSALEIDLIIRAYDEGGAYRFGIPSGDGTTVASETGGFAIPTGTIGWGAPPAADYQGLWDSRSEASLTSSSFELPVLIKTPNGAYAFLSEAAVYGTVYWASTVDGKKGLLALNGGDHDAPVALPFVTPWRVAMVGTSLARIVESTLVENLNPPSEITDTSWIHSGRSAWSWWSGDSTSDYATQKAYVDFAASMGWEYYLCDAGWDASWVPNLVQYANSKGVGIWIWYDGADLDTDAKRTAVIAQAATWGVKGLKVDYMFGDELGALANYDEISRETAKKHLMVNFHGATKPSGERRRWPHVMTREAIFGAEQYKGQGDGPTAKFNCILPFTRNVQGPMDYTPVTYSNTEGKTTYAHQTALDVVFESGVQHLADTPSSYQSNTAHDLLKAAPARWDETKLVEGDPGSFVTLARKSGNDWYVGSIADAARTANIPLAFLGAGSFTAQIYRDGSSDTEQVKEEQTVTSSTVLTIPIRRHGGCAVRITPK